MATQHLCSFIYPEQTLVSRLTANPINFLVSAIATSPKYSLFSQRIPGDRGDFMMSERQNKLKIIALNAIAVFIMQQNAFDAVRFAWRDSRFLISAGFPRCFSNESPPRFRHVIFSTLTARQKLGRGQVGGEWVVNGCSMGGGSGWLGV